MEPLSGNISDKKTIIRTIKELKQNLITDETVYHMADSAFYSAESISSLGQQCFWITRVPETIKEAQLILASDVVWIPCSDPRYSYAIFESSYGGVDQRWVMFHSVEKQKRSIQTHKRNITKTLKKDKISLKKSMSMGLSMTQMPGKQLKSGFKNTRGTVFQISQYQSKTREKPEPWEGLKRMKYLSKCISSPVRLNSTKRLSPGKRSSWAGLSSPAMIPRLILSSCSLIKKNKTRSNGDSNSSRTRIFMLQRSTWRMKTGLLPC